MLILYLIDLESGHDICCVKWVGILSYQFYAAYYEHDCDDTAPVPVMKLFQKRL